MALSEPSKSQVQVSVSPIDAGQLKSGSYALLNGSPCKIMQIKFAKTGKHGSAKAIITGVDVLTRKKVNWTGPNTTTLSSFILDRREYIVLDVSLVHQKEGLKDTELSGIEIDYLDEKDQVKQTMIDYKMGQEIKKIMAQNDTVSLKIKIVRAPSQLESGKLGLEPYTLELVESFSVS